MSSGMLMSFAETTRLLSLISVMGCFTLMAFFIIRLICEDMLNNPHPGVTRVPRAPPPQVAVKKIKLPLQSVFKKAFSTKEFSMDLWSGEDDLKRVHLRTYAGVPVSSFYKAVYSSPWPWFEDAFFRGKLFNSDQMGELRDLEIISNRGKPMEIVCSRPEPEQEIDFDDILEPRDPSTSRNINNNNTTRDSRNARKKYPFVNCFIVNKNEESSSPEKEEDVVGAVIQVVHVRDEKCSIPSQVLFTFVKLRSSGTTIQLHNLFMSSLTEDESGSICVICHDSEVTRVILPCRHAAVCGGCFPMLKETCPMCRTPIQSYFLLKPEPERAEIPSKITDAHLEELRRRNSGLRERINAINRTIFRIIGVVEE